MLIVRLLLQLASGLVALAALFFAIKSPSATNVAFVVFFILVILVLGPWWPSAEKAQKWKLDLPTDDSKIALPLFAAAMGAFSFFQAWDAYTEPNQHFHRFEVFIARILGAEGVALVWLVVGLGCFMSAWRAFRRIKAAQHKNVA